MSNVLLDKEEEEKENILMNFAVIKGGKDEGPPTDELDWLTPLEIGTIFLVEEKNNPRNFNLGQFQVVDRTERTTFLVTKLNGIAQTFVKPLTFCSQYRLYEILGVVKLEETLEEKDNG